MAAKESSVGVPEIWSSFPNIIGIIFNNWTAIKLAVEHGMAGTPDIAQRKLNALVTAVSQVFTSGNVEWYDVSDLLAEAMDSEFCTVLEDDSSDQVAVHLCQLYQLFRAGDVEALCSALSSLPNQSPIHLTPPLHRTSPHVEEEFTENSEEPDPPADDGWTVVKRK